MKAPHKHADANEVLKVLPAEARNQIREWARADERHPVIRRANFLTQLKILSIYAAFVAALAAYLATGGHWATVLAGVFVLGIVAIPFLRVFMHSQGHWAVGNGPVRN